ncbi:hypothetical protein RFH42_16525 [Acinetobacter rudis]|uniref:hypothetical protein n=1 Tax=Acinetobacter rudis TaxID=632955 RepID=UPI00280C8464|nr:hypothetical protein [Acinetobacter rudis]MDQ8954556.1 hypothetical protein [Acinetobacter rudis]
MNAYEFIKQYGLDLAHRDIACLESGFITEQDFIEANGFEFEELRRVVESHELVERFDGLDSCKLGLYYLDKNNISSFEHRFVDDLSCTTIRFKQAIADVEACQ